MNNITLCTEYKDRTHTLDNKMAATGAGATTEAQQPLAGLKVCIDGSRTLLRELEKAGTAPPEELAKVQDLLECLDRNAEQIASALAGSRRRKSTDALGAVASLLREQDQYFQQVRQGRVLSVWFVFSQPST